MKKELFIHIPFAVAFVAISSIFQGWMDLKYWPIWLGALFGTILPDIDNLVSSQFLGEAGISPIFKDKTAKLGAKLSEALHLMYVPRSITQKPIFHTSQFQLVFVVFTFLLITSSGSLFGIGLVLGFILHLSIDQIVDFMEVGNIDKWFADFPVALDTKKRFWFLIANLVIVLVFGLFL